MTDALLSRTSSATDGAPAPDVLENSAAPPFEIQAFGIQVGLEKAEGQGIADEQRFGILEHLEGHQSRDRAQVDTLDRQVGTGIEPVSKVLEGLRWPRPHTEESEVEIAVAPLPDRPMAPEAHHGLQSVQPGGHGCQTLEDVRCQGTPCGVAGGHGDSLSESEVGTKCCRGKSLWQEAGCGQPMIVRARRTPTQQSRVSGSNASFR